MLVPEHLTLRLISLESSGEWAHKSDGLAFVFPQEGAGQYACGSVARDFGAGDVLVSNGGRGARLSASNCGKAVFGCFSLRLEHLFPLFAADEVSCLGEVTENLGAFKLYP